MFWPKKKTKIRGAPAAALRPVRQRIANGKLTLKQVAGIVKRPGKVILPGGRRQGTSQFGVSKGSIEDVVAAPDRRRLWE